MALTVSAVVAAGADARRVAVLVVPQPESVPPGGAAGLYVAGRGLHVSREEAVDALAIDTLPRGPCGKLSRCPIEVFVTVPPLGERPNTRRYEVTIRGRGYRGILVSDSTRIRGLVSTGDVRDTVRALEAGREAPIESRPTVVPGAELQRLDDRLDDARRAQLPATVAMTAVLIVLAALALLRRSAPLARAALLYPLGALLLALAVSALDLVGPVVTTAAVVLAAPVALLARRLRDDRFALAVAVALAIYGLVLAASPETNSFSGLGPHPWTGGRFHGTTNQVATLLLAPALAAAAALREWRLAALGALCLVVIGSSVTGADGGGLLVFAIAFAVLWLRLARRPRPLLAAAAAVGGVAAVVALDLATGGSSHVADAVREGPGELLDAFTRRLGISWSIVTAAVAQALLFAAGITALAWLAALRPRAAATDALLAALAVSLLVNDSPTKVAGFGAVMCAALRAWSVSSERAPGIDSRE